MSDSSFPYKTTFSHSHQGKADDAKAKNIVFATPEVFPFSVTGGLGKVAAALPAELAAKGDDVTVVSPWYPDLFKNFDNLNKELQANGKAPVVMRAVESVNVPFDKGEEQVQIATLEYNNVTYIFARHDDFGDDYFQDGQRYGYDNDNDRFALFSRSVPHVVDNVKNTDPANPYIPDIVHTHDWQTGFLPVILNHSDESLLPKGWKGTPSVHTIHRAEFFGDGLRSADDMAQLLRLPHNIKDLADFSYGKEDLANPVWSAIGNASHVTTVSPTYAEELKRNETDPETHEKSFYLDFAYMGDKLSGVVNGINTHTINAQHSPYFEEHFSVDNMGNKAALKEAALAKYGLTDASRPLAAIITRASKEKGTDILAESLEKMVTEQGWNVILFAGGDKEIEAQLEALAEKYPNNIKQHSRFGNNNEVHTLLAGADATIMPSKSEPCGLVQMEAHAYGTIPIARATGGLIDTIVDKDGNSNTGFLYDTFTADSLLEATGRAAGMYSNDKQSWNTIVQNAMNTDHSWKKSADAYQQIYDTIVQERQQQLRKGFSLN